MKRIFMLADPDSIHTKKWIRGWELINYSVVLSGLSPYHKNNKNIFFERPKLNGNNGMIFLKNILNFKKLLSELEGVIINAHYMTSYGLIASLIKRKKDRLILSLHGTDVMITMDKNFVYLLLSKFIFFRSDLIISVSQTMTKKILDIYPKLEKKIITQQYGIEIEKIREYYSEQKSIDILTNRTWIKNSNYEVVLNVLEKHKDRNMSIIGFNNSEYAIKLKQKHTLINHFIYGKLSYEKNVMKVAKSKIFISLTTSDGTPLSVIESMYLGAIPIVSDLKTNRELIKDGENGFLIPIDEVELHKKIKFVSNLSEDELKRIRLKNKKIISEKFNMEKNFKQLDERIKKLRRRDDIFRICSAD